MPDHNKKKFNKYIRYSSLAIQMGVTITIFALLGRKIDIFQENTFPIWTLSLTLFSIFGSLYRVIRSILKMTKEEEEKD